MVRDWRGHKDTSGVVLAIEVLRYLSLDLDTRTQVFVLTGQEKILQNRIMTGSCSPPAHVTTMVVE